MSVPNSAGYVKADEQLDGSNNNAFVKKRLHSKLIGSPTHFLSF